MNNTGWRTLVVQDHERLSLHDGQIKLDMKETETEVPIGQLSQLIIMSPEGSITLPLLDELAARHVSVIFCDSKRNPSAELIGINQHTESAGCVMDQACWTQGRKMLVWQEIVRNKIILQSDLLEQMHLPNADMLTCYAADLVPGDLSNREGQAARVYFKTLFGQDFIRHCGDEVNLALDYGYAILRSAVSRVLVLHGYHPALGIHHESRFNPTNLSCDLMEPFRPFVDCTVYANQHRTLTWEYKKELIGVLQKACRYGGRSMNLQNAVEYFSMDVLKAMTEPEHRVEAIRFAGKEECDDRDV